MYQCISISMSHMSHMSLYEPLSSSLIGLLEFQSPPAAIFAKIKAHIKHLLWTSNAKRFHQIYQYNQLPLPQWKSHEIGIARLLVLLHRLRKAVFFHLRCFMRRLHLLFMGVDFVNAKYWQRNIKTHKEFMRSALIIGKIR